MNIVSSKTLRSALTCLKNQNWIFAFDLKKPRSHVSMHVITCSYNKSFVCDCSTIIQQILHPYRQNTVLLKIYDAHKCYSNVMQFFFYCVNSVKSLSETFILVKSVWFTKVEVPVIKSVEIYIRVFFIIRRIMGKQVTEKPGWERERRGCGATFPGPAHIPECIFPCSKCTERHFGGRVCPVVRVFHNGN
jgi:hypothetical protein